jgi:hypothetical protein
MNLAGGGERMVTAAQQATSGHEIPGGLVILLALVIIGVIVYAGSARRRG